MSVAVQDNGLPQEIEPLPALELEQAIEQKKIGKYLKQKKSKKLSIKQKIALAIAKKKLKKRLKKEDNPDYNYGERTQLTAFLLCVLVGFLGIHRFYIGHYWMGVLQLLTLGCCGVFVIVDIIFIVVNRLRTPKGDRLIPW
ncbi:MAG: TM2 domain-containing protein [Aureispira sp.]|nr:TM2 domain-containing protein [Aureispira sp.]